MRYIAINFYQHIARPEQFFLSAFINTRSNIDNGAAI